MTKHSIPFLFPYTEDEHRAFFEETVREIGSAWPPIITAIYLLSALPETRTRFWDLMDLDGQMKNDCWDESWQSADTHRLISLAVNLGWGDTYADLSPAQLYDTPLRPILRAAVHFWYNNAYTA